MEAMRLLIAGSRTFPAAELDSLDARVLSLPDDAVVISGGAKGPDERGEQAAKQRGLATDIWRVVEVRENSAEGKWQYAFAIEREQTDRDGGRSKVMLVNRWVFDYQNRRSRHKAFGRAAFWRNSEMTLICTDAEVWWDGHSRGTRHTLNFARKLGKLRAIHYPSFVPEHLREDVQLSFL